MLNVLETKAAPLLNDKIIQGQGLDNEEKAIFALFVAVMFFRIPQYHNWLGEFASGILQQLAEQQHQVYLQHPEIFDALKEDYRRETGTADADHLKPEDIAPSRFPALTAAKPFVLGISLLQVEEFSRAIARMNWTFLKASFTDSFITSDSPCFMVDPTFVQSGYLGGWQNNNVEITLPLSRDVALLVRWHGEDMIWEVATKEIIDEINSRTASYASRFLIASKAGIVGVESWMDKWPLLRS